MPESMRTIPIQDWQAMRPDEKEAAVFDSLGVPKRELAHVIAEWEFDSGRKPNAIFVSIYSLAPLPIVLKKILGLRVIPIDADPGRFIISLEDPWDWGDLFYS